MSSSTLRAAILIVSTTAAKDPSADASGGILREVFEQGGDGKWEVTETQIVGDEVDAIQRSVVGWADVHNAVNVIITTGGTGFAISDRTPEVCRSHIRRSNCDTDAGGRRSLPSYINKPLDLFMECLLLRWPLPRVRLMARLFWSFADLQSCADVTTCCGSSE